MCDFLPPGELVTFFLITFCQDGIFFICTPAVRYGLARTPPAVRRRRRRSWLAKRAEHFISYTGRNPIYSYGIFYFCVLAHHNWGGGEWAGGWGGAARGCAVVPHQSPTTQPNYALQVCFSRRKLIRGSEKSTVDLSFSLLTK